MLHFSPLLLQQGVLILEIKESMRTGAATYDTQIFKQLNPVLELLTLISGITYLYFSHRLIERFYQRLKFSGGDRYRTELRWLHRLLKSFGLLWLLWIPYIALGLFLFSLPVRVICLLSFVPPFIGDDDLDCGDSFFKAGSWCTGPGAFAFKTVAIGGLETKRCLAEESYMEVNRFYQDAELSLPSLAEALNIPTHELSRIINVALKKNFNDFINEYRVVEVARKMQDPAFDHITLLGIAFDCGFNSKTTFNRTFKQMTCKSPAEYKIELKKERPSYNLERQPRFSTVISNYKTTPRWSDEILNRNYMFKNYLKIAWRNLVRNKAHGMINILGLSVGLAFSLLILLWVQQELSVDGFHQNGKQLYSVYERQYFDNQVQANYYTPALLAEELKKKLPDVQYAANAMYDLLSTFSVGDKSLTFNGVGCRK